MSCQNFSCSTGCGTGCTGGATCSGGAANGGCSGNCGGTCTGWCSSGCMDSGGDSGGGCSGCTGSCSGGCEGTCKDNCGKGCNTGCSTNEALDLYQKLTAGLNKRIYASDMKNINRMIEIEASSQRFNKNITSVNFASKIKANSDQIKKLQANLIAIGQEISANADTKVKVWESTGQELITKVLNSADTTITTD